MKRTKKYLAAEKIALEIKLQIDQNIYDNLQNQGYFWDSKIGIWQKMGEAEAPTGLLYVRVWADKEEVANHADLLIEKMQEQDYCLEDRSDIYLCRPPKHSEGRIYLVFKPKGKN